MVYLGNELWGDIYLSSDDGANGLQSVYGGTPITGTEGINWYIAGERARRVGKRLPDYMEFTVAADGSPQGLDASNANGHTATTNKARTTVGKIANAISALNICDLVGNVWKWLNELLHDPTAASAAWYDVFWRRLRPGVYVFKHWLARPHWRRQLEQRRALRLPDGELQQLPVEREHEHWRVVRV